MNTFQRGSISLSALLVILLGVIVFGGGAYYVAQQSRSPQQAPVQQNATGTDNSPVKADNGVVTGGGDTTSATFSATPTLGPAPLAITFSASVSGDPSIYSIDFGDGSSGTLSSPPCAASNPAGCTPRADHTYVAPGTYTASLYKKPDPRSATPASRLLVGSITITVR